MNTLPASTAALFCAFTLSSAAAADGPPPPTVSQPAGINLGGTSFYDGFAGEPGLSHLVYLKYDSASSFRSANGKENSALDNPRLNVTTFINQFSYYSERTIGAGAHPGWSLLLPLVSLDGQFGADGPELKDNATGLGDITTGPQLQFDPIVDAQGRPVFVQRLAMDFILPTGKYDKHKDINQSSGFYSINPYWAATWMPAARWEVSWRLHYLYNFKNGKPASSSPQFFDGRPVRDTQAGKSAWVNFTTSYEVLPRLSVGLNGYYFKQLSDDRINGQTLEGSREKVLGIGPGLFWKINPQQGLWLNLYHETNVENRARNDFSVQVRFAHAL